MTELPNENPEAGLRNHRPEFIREDTFGSTPADPSILKYSHTMTNFTWASDSVNEPQRGLGDANPVGFIKGPETHELTIGYDLVKWFVQNGGQAYDAAYDGLVRDSDQLLPNSHTLLDREAKGQINKNQTISGNTPRPTRIYTVAKGGLIDEAAITGSPSDAQPVTVELSYLAQKGRSYQIDQPTSTTSLTVVSSDNSDTSQTLTVESEGANSVEQVTLNGTTVVGTSTSFGNIDVLELDTETVGDVTVSINEGSTSSPTAGDALSIINGKASYRGVEGDLGVPALGAGAREDISGQPVETFIGDQISRDGVEYPYEISSATLTVANNIEETERSNGFGMALHPGNAETTMEATMFGEAMTHDLLMQELTNTTDDITWEMDGGTVELPDSICQEPGERAAETEQAVMTTDNAFMSEGINFV